MNRDKIDEFTEGLRYLLLEYENQYMKKHYSIDIIKMRKAINQRKEIKKLMKRAYEVFWSI